jgi:hypothetical protein
MARCSNPEPPWVWPSARRPAALSGSLVRVTAPGETDSRGRNALRGRRLSSDAAKLDSPETGLIPEQPGPAMTPGQGRLWGGSVLRRYAAGSRPNRCRRPPWRTAITCWPARPAGAGAVVDDFGVAQPVGPATTMAVQIGVRNEPSLGCGQGRHRAETLVDVQINVAGRSRATCVFPG